ncbi:MAG: ATP-dependent DNA helicase RecG [Cyclobacteriaceae bacterium]
MSRFFETKIEFLKGVGPQRAALLNKELGIFTYADLIQHYPFRYEDRTQFHEIAQINENMPFIQVKGVVRHVETIGLGRKKRLVAYLKDTTGEVELTWFKGIPWALKRLSPGAEYVVFGKPNKYGRKYSIAHPEVEPASAASLKGGYLQPVYPTTEMLKSRYIDSKAISKFIKSLLVQAVDRFEETLSNDLIDVLKLMDKRTAMIHIHFPKNSQTLQKAQFRLKFEELFYTQVRLLKLKIARVEKFRGIVLDNSSLLTRFYNEHLPFDLTNAQKRVIKECYRDLKSGKQMNRLVQGDVGSGKTIVAFICMLVAIGTKTQAALMAPTEILAEQHFNGLLPFCDAMGLTMARLTGSSKKSERKVIHEQLLSGELNVLVGTHALLEDVVQFKKLGLAVIDEQHRFGVAQRAKLWKKNTGSYPHVLVMTATPIPRTLAMTLYGDLDISQIDELPSGRKPIMTSHQFDSQRLKVFGFVKEQINLSRQVYIVYPLIEESATMDYKDLMDGYESVARAFPNIPVSIVHGRMKPVDKDFEMQRFVKGETKIMVATTVIEVGVNVPNASVMIIENAERFGLAQLHQLRGRVGRGADQSYCVLMTSYKLSKEAKVRLETMVRTTDGFEIADIDLKLRGPGDLTGTQQSGVMDLLLADLSKDGEILSLAREKAISMLDADPHLDLPENQPIKRHIASLTKNVVNWSRIS